MELNEKLQELRKSRGLTQEELAEALFVSRTAVSKWESGRGCPSIDSLREISRFFSVSIDELLSGDKLLSLAEKENTANLQRMCSLLIGIADILAVILILLPLYPKAESAAITSVNLYAYTLTSPLYGRLYWVLFLLMIMGGLAKAILTHLCIQKGQKTLTFLSFALSALAVLILALTGKAYAVSLLFMLLMIKGWLLFKHTKHA